MHYVLAEKGGLKLRRGKLLIAAAVAAVWAGHGSSQPASALQQQFNQASAAFESENWRVAADQFAELRRRTDLTPRVTAVSRIREGYARLRLGDEQAAIDLLESGLSELPADDALASDRLLAVEGLASGYETVSQILLSAGYFRQQVELAPDAAAKKAGYAGLARTIMFDDPQEAIQAAEQLRLMSDQPRDRAVALDLKARAQLIAGNSLQAIDTLKMAVSQLGGLTQRIDQLDDAVRADMALAGLLSGDEQLAHLYLSATGTAQDPGGFLPIPKQISGRICPEDASPNDVAIVEFGVDRDGSIRDVRPIYATAGSAFADAMVRYVRYFRWDPAQVAHLRPLQASMARLEVHCIPELAGLDQLNKDAEPRYTWMKALGLSDYEVRAGSQAARLTTARAELARRKHEYGSLSPQLFPVLEFIGRSPLVGTRETLDIVDRQRKIAEAARAPAAVMASLEVRRATAGVTDHDTALSRIIAIANNANFRQDPEASAYLDLEVGVRQSIGGKSAEALSRAADAKGLPATDAIRRSANLWLAESDFSKDPTDRKKRVQAAGVNYNSCEAAHVRRTTLASSRDYPELTRRWGFEGWTFVQFDIGSDSRPRNVVASVSYPPLIFTPAAVRTASQMRFEVNDALIPQAGCTDYATPVQFQIR